MANSSSKQRLLTILVLGFASGLPLGLTGSTLQAWFTQAGLSLLTIGSLSLVGQPYVYKFLWAPLLDRYAPAFWDRRRSWLLLTQLILVATIGLAAFANPRTHPWILIGLATVIAFLSASQDIVFDAYRTEITRPHERGLSAACMTGGYRLAMLVSGGLALLLANATSWRATYLIMAGLMLVGVIASWKGESPPAHTPSNTVPTRLWDSFIEPWRELIQRKNVCFLFSLIICYKLGDALSLSLTTPFLLRELGFSLSTVGMVNKGFGLLATLTGISLGGLLMTRIRLEQALLLFGVLQIVAILMLVLLSVVGHNYPLLIITICADNMFNGMGTAALLALLMSLCDTRYTATQYAIFSAIAASGRIFIGPVAAMLVNHLGWTNFFLCAALAAAPGVILVSRGIKLPHNAH